MCSAYAAPADAEAQLFKNLRQRIRNRICGTSTAPEPTEDDNDGDDAEAQFWGALLRGGLRLAPHVIGALGNGEAREARDYEDDGDAEAQFWGSVLRGALKVAPHVIGALGNGEAWEAQDYESDSDESKAEVENFWKTLGVIGKTVGPVTLHALGKK